MQKFHVTHLEIQGSVPEISFIDLEFGDLLGGFIVHRGCWKSKNMAVAIKRVPATFKTAEVKLYVGPIMQRYIALLILFMQIEILNKLGHPHIIQFLGILVDRPGPQECYIVTGIETKLYFELTIVT